MIRRDFKMVYLKRFNMWFLLIMSYIAFELLIFNTSNLYEFTDYIYILGMNLNLWVFSQKIYLLKLLAFIIELNENLEQCVCV